MWSVFFCCLCEIHGGKWYEVPLTEVWVRFRMRIGDFAQKFDISIDAVRYYIENGLLLPEKIHNQYTFDHSCEEDIERILAMKKMRFTITEIKMLFSLYRLTQLVDEKDVRYFESFYVKKREELLLEKASLEEALLLIHAEIDRLQTQSRAVYRPFGIPISFFGAFACPRCEEPLEVGKASVEGNMIYEGELVCSCGYHARIEDGIVITPSSREEEGPSYLQEENPIRAYLDKTDPLFVSFTKKGFDWVMKRISLENRPLNVLEIGSGFCFFLMGFIDKLPDKTTYIMAENHLPLVRYAKKYFETNYPNKKLIFICTDFNELPLRRESIHCVFDLFGSTTHSFASDFYPVRNVLPLLKKEGYWYGSYLYFEPEEAELQPGYKKYRQMFELDRIQLAFSALAKIESSRLAEIQVTPDLLDRFLKDSIVSLWVYKGQKMG